MSNRIKLGLIGCGVIGTYHAKAMASSDDIEFVAEDPSAGLAQQEQAQTARGLARDDALAAGAVGMGGELDESLPLLPEEGSPAVGHETPVLRQAPLRDAPARDKLHRHDGRGDGGEDQQEIDEKIAHGRSILLYPRS